VDTYSFDHAQFPDKIITFTRLFVKLGPSEFRDFVLSEVIVESNKLQHNWLFHRRRFFAVARNCAEFSRWFFPPFFHSDANVCAQLPPLRWSFWQLLVVWQSAVDRFQSRLRGALAPSILAAFRQSAKTYLCERTYCDNWLCDTAFLNSVTWSCSAIALSIMHVTQSLR